MPADFTAVADAQGTSTPVIQVRDLEIRFEMKNRVVRAVDGVSFDLYENEILGIVGETGSGKSITGRSLMGLVPVPPARVAGGSVTFRPGGRCPFCEGRGCRSCRSTGEAVCPACAGSGCGECGGSGRPAIDLLDLPPVRMRQLRGMRIAMIFQDASKSLNPVLTIRDQVAEVFFQHRAEDLLAELGDSALLPVRRAAHQAARGPEKLLLRVPPFRSQAATVRRKVDDLVAQALADVQIANPRKIMESYPHQLSGGMKQRVMIAQAMACDPEVLIADEPTTALDTTVQARIIELIVEMQRRSRAAVLYISHDLSVVRMVCDRVGVMYAGQMVEVGPAKQVFDSPQHPYTRALLAAVPSVGKARGELAAIEGSVPEFTEGSHMCRFHNRCPHAAPVCASVEPRLRTLVDGQSVACLGYESAGDLGLDATATPGCPVDPDQSECRMSPRVASQSAVPIGEPVLSAIGVRKHYPVKEGALQRVVGQVRAVDGVSFDVLKGQTLGIVGESGCGKTTLGRCLTALQDSTAGGVYFELPDDARSALHELHSTPAEDLSPAARTQLAELDQRYRVDRLVGEARRHYRRNCQMVFQDAFASLNPRHLVRDIVGRPFSIYKEARGRERTERVVELLEAVGMGAQHLNRYPHEFSGGQQQRISIARALALDPEVIVLDEPTSALDVSVQAQILNLLHELQKARNLTYVFVSHDLGVIQHISDRILVMYLGQIVEDGPTSDVFTSPKHPYTQALIDANPALVDSDARMMKGLAGSVPDPARPPQGCRFHTRCPVATAHCGWDFSDAVDWLTNHDELRNRVHGSKAKSPFAGDITMADAQAATQAQQLLQSSAPAPMRRAMLEATLVRRHAVAAFRGSRPGPAARGHACAPYQLHPRDRDAGGGCRCSRAPHRLRAIVRGTLLTTPELARKRLRLERRGSSLRV